MNFQSRDVSIFINKAITLLLLFFVIEMKALAIEKNLVVKRLDTQDGLSENYVSCILKDNQGFMWIGTKDGLNRFDGREFYVFKHNEADRNSICGNNITCLELDADSLLWVGTAGNGFCSYDFRTGKFTSYSKSNMLLPSNNINDIEFDSTKNKLWLAYNNTGLQLFNLKTKNVDNPQKGISANTYFDVEVNDTITYFAGIMESLKRPEKLGKNRTTVTDTASTINKIFIDDDKKIWCGAWDNGLHQFDVQANRVHSYFFDGSYSLSRSSGNEIISLAKDVDNVLWCGTKNTGILFFNLRTLQFEKDVTFSPAITSRINCIYRDNNNRMWIGTETGLFIYNPLQNQFEAIHLPVPDKAFRCKVYDRLITKSGKEYIVSECGLFYRYPPDVTYLYKEFTYENDQLQLHSIFSDYKNRIYIGSNKTIFTLDTITLQLKTIKCSRQWRETGFQNVFFSMTSSRVKTITQLKAGNDTLILANFYGQYIFGIHPEKENIYYLQKDTTSPVNGTMENLNRKLFVDSKNTIWSCGASLGISKLMLANALALEKAAFSDSITRTIYLSHKNWANKTFGSVTFVNDVFDIADNHDDTYWISTQGNGLLKFFPENDSVPFVSYAADFNSLQGLIKTDKNNIWIISSAGLLNYNIKNNRYKLYDKKNGISESISGYFFQNNNAAHPEKINAGFDGGFISFNPKEIIPDVDVPRVNITRLWIMDTPCDSLLFAPLKLSYHQKFLKFYVSANSFSYNEQTTFMYFLEGIDEHWRNNHGNPLITYTNLPPGSFVLKVKAINSDGMESDVLELPVTIEPPFYKTFVFYIAMGFLITGAIYMVYRYRIKQILRLQEVRNKIARDLHDDIGSTLGSIHLYSQIANFKLLQKKPEEITEILHRIGSSSQEIIDKTGDAVWVVKASNDTLKNLIIRMESYAAGLLGTAGIQFTINYDEKMGDLKMEMGRRKNIFLIFKEAIHNILKYADCDQVAISIIREGNKVHFLIKDNGKGFNATGINPYNGNGIKNMHMRAEEMGGNLLLVSAEGAGTSIEIIV